MTPRLWNSLPPAVRSCVTINRFKTAVENYAISRSLLYITNYQCSKKFIGYLFSLVLVSSHAGKYCAILITLYIVILALYKCYYYYYYYYKEHKFIEAVIDCYYYQLVTTPTR